MKNKIGYCCICLGINEGKSKKDLISVNRGMVKKTFDAKGLSYVSELTLLNLQDTLKILDYNIKNNIQVYSAIVTEKRSANGDVIVYVNGQTAFNKEDRHNAENWLNMMINAFKRSK